MNWLLETKEFIFKTATQNENTNIMESKMKTNSVESNITWKLDISFQILIYLLILIFYFLKKSQNNEMWTKK